MEEEAAQKASLARGPRHPRGASYRDATYPRGYRDVVPPPFFDRDGGPPRDRDPLPRGPTGEGGPMSRWPPASGPMEENWRSKGPDHTRQRSDNNNRGSPNFEQSGKDASFEKAGPDWDQQQVRRGQQQYHHDGGVVRQGQQYHHDEFDKGPYDRYNGDFDREPSWRSSEDQQHPPRGDGGHPPRRYHGGGPPPPRQQDEPNWERGVNYQQRNDSNMRDGGPPRDMHNYGPGEYAEFHRDEYGDGLTPKFGGGKYGGEQEYNKGPPGGHNYKGAGAAQEGDWGSSSYNKGGPPQYNKTGGPPPTTRGEQHGGGSYYNKGARRERNFEHDQQQAMQLNFENSPIARREMFGTARVGNGGARNSPAVHNGRREQLSSDHQHEDRFGANTHPDQWAEDHDQWGAGGDHHDLQTGGQWTEEHHQQRPRRDSGYGGGPRGGENGRGGERGEKGENGRGNEHVDYSRGERGEKPENGRGNEHVDYSRFVEGPREERGERAAGGKARGGKKPEPDWSIVRREHPLEE